ncbi:DUF1372 family protein [Streptococcus minor]|uniref:DUF1372 family protein n=1 Tax=Streptococcus minor TaxID=229549 RepID=UPI000364DF8D|nr:DUF1372 family protein [Streptococcus minor]
MKKIILIVILCLFWALTLALAKMNNRIIELESRQPVIIYQVDNAGAAMIGKVTGKAIVDGKHTLDCGIYGKFLVTKEVYDSVQVGDDIPEELK